MSGSENENAAAGECPFCGTAGSIVDATSWCGHHVATYDMMMGSEPVDCLEEDGEFNAFRDFLSSFEELSEKEQQRLLKPLPEDLLQFLRGAADNPVELFWLGLLPTKELQVDVSEGLFDTTYVSIFVEDAAAARKLLSDKVRSIMEKVSID
jgi:hypothetical protein